jgi:hypothetical protein
MEGAGFAIDFLRNLTRVPFLTSFDLSACLLSSQFGNICRQLINCYFVVIFALRSFSIFGPHEIMQMLTTKKSLKIEWIPPRGGSIFTLASEIKHPLSQTNAVPVKNGWAANENLKFTTIVYSICILKLGYNCESPEFCLRCAFAIYRNFSLHSVFANIFYVSHQTFMVFGN